MSTERIPDPRPSVPDVQRLVNGRLSPRTRCWMTALLCLDAGIVVAVGSLWLTEPALPLRTHAAFALLELFALAWCAYLGWTLSRRQLFLAQHRLVAGRIAVTCAASFVVMASTLAIVQPDQRTTAGLAAIVGLIPMGFSLWMLLRASRVVADLRRRRNALEA